MKFLLSGFFVSFLASACLADVSVKKIESELRQWFDQFPLQEIIDTKSNEDEVTAFIRVTNTINGGVVSGAANFVRMDSGSWYLMSAQLFPNGNFQGIGWLNILYAVDID